MNIEQTRVRRGAARGARPVAAGEDYEIAGAVRSVFDRSAHAYDEVHVEVSDGFATLTGRVTWKFQHAAMRRRVAAVAGVTAVANLTVVALRASAADVARRIGRILPDTLGGRPPVSVSAWGWAVELAGELPTAADRERAEAAAWACPNVAAVRNGIVVRPAAGGNRLNPDEE